MKTEELSILIMGAGVTGKAALEALAPRVQRIAVYDEAAPAELADLQSEFPQLTLHTKDTPPDLHDYDLLLKSPGIEPRHPLLGQAETAGIPVWSDAELAYRLFPDRQIAGITGTNGKTTTTALLCHIAAGERTVHCLGNIGVGILPAFFSGGEEDLYVLELSSFQLTHSPSLRTSVCGILNLSPDHINWHGTMESYVAAKSGLLLQQTAKDIAVLNMDDPLLKELGQRARSRVVPISLSAKEKGFSADQDRMLKDGQLFFDFGRLRIPGEHNRQNALVAAAMAWSLGISEDTIREGLSTFAGVAHRIEYIGQKDGVDFYNDSKGTNVDASIKAVQALPHPIRLLAGGMDKKVSYLPLIEQLDGKVVKLYLYGETSDLIRRTAEEYGFREIAQFADLADATTAAFADSEPGDTILLSPASASWDMYPNFETRGDHFRAIATDLGVTRETQKD